MNKNSNRKEKLDLKRVSGGLATVISGVDDHNKKYTSNIITLRVDKDGVINNEDVKLLLASGYDPSTQTWAMDPEEINKRKTLT